MQQRRDVIGDVDLGSAVGGRARRDEGERAGIDGDGIADGKIGGERIGGR
jgi:hypothetical protein